MIALDELAADHEGAEPGKVRTASCKTVSSLQGEASEKKPWQTCVTAA